MHDAFEEWINKIDKVNFKAKIDQTLPNLILVLLLSSIATGSRGLDLNHFVLRAKQCLNGVKSRSI